MKRIRGRCAKGVGRGLICQEDGERVMFQGGGERVNVPK